MITLSSFKLTSLLNSIESKIENNYSLEGVEIFAKDSIDAFAFEKGISFANDKYKIYKSCSQKYTWFFKANNENEIVEQLNTLVNTEVSSTPEVEQEEEEAVETPKKKKRKARKVKQLVGYSRTQLCEASKEEYEKMVEHNVALAELTGSKAERYRVCAKKARQRRAIEKDKKLWDMVNKKIKAS